MYPFHPCSTIAVIGCTGSGKTTWVHEFLKQSANMFFDEPSKKYFVLLQRFPTIVSNH